ncbi:Sap-like sulfolipid-1-addressing protein [Paramicrobacterium agarici]|nr:Sap-like sulfolipid-1-addressing protein [Microbacterium agarici]
MEFMDIDSFLSTAFDGPALLGVLAVLALIDSTSFGTLLIPVWLLLAPGRLRPGRMLVYLGTITAFYAAVGIMIALGATFFTDAIAAFFASPVARWLQLLLGAGMLVFSFTMDTGKKGGDGESPRSGRLARWRARAMGVQDAGEQPASNAPSGGAATATRAALAPLMMLALTAALIEVASMLPYLAGIGLISASDVGWPGSAGLIVGYCIVMVLPALVLLGARIVAHKHVEPLLQRINAWITKNAASSTAWIVGIVGFLLARDAATALGLFDALNALR